MFTQRIQRRLKEQKARGLYRDPLPIQERFGREILIDGRKILNFASNDYIGVASSEKAKSIATKNFQKYAPSSSSSRLVTGNYRAIQEAEAAFADHFGYEAALFFPSGYQANLALLSTLFEAGDVVYFDKHIHASSVKGLSLSKATLLGFKHNSLDHLRRRITQNKESTPHNPDRQQGVVTEALFSMDGDFANFDELRTLRANEDLLTIIDEAHSFGAVGVGGCGCASGIADIAVGTMGKALGLFGAFLCLPQTFKEYLFNFASPLIYSTTLPEAHAATAMELLVYVKELEGERERLQNRSRQLRESLRSEGFHCHGDAHIVALEIGDEKRAAYLAKLFLKRQILVFPARFPTVAAGKAILRISLTSNHTSEDIHFFTHTLKELYEESLCCRD